MYLYKNDTDGDHAVTLQHFTNHFTAHPWIQISKINEQTTTGEMLHGRSWELHVSRLM